MATVKRPYGPWSQSMLQGLRDRGELKVAAFVAFLEERRIKIDRTLVSHWIAGRSHLPADILPLLAQFTGRPDLVFGHHLRAANCAPVRLPEAVPEGRKLTELLLMLGVTLGRLQAAVVEAWSPASPGGEAITREERGQLMSLLDELIQQLADLRAQLGARGA